MCNIWPAPEGTWFNVRAYKPFMRIPKYTCVCVSGLSRKNLHTTANSLGSNRVASVRAAQRALKSFSPCPQPQWLLTGPSVVVNCFPNTLDVDRLEPSDGYVSENEDTVDVQAENINSVVAMPTTPNKQWESTSEEKQQELDPIPVVEEWIKSNLVPESFRRQQYNRCPRKCSPPFNDPQPLTMILMINLIKILMDTVDDPNKLKFTFQILKGDGRPEKIRSL